MSKKCKTLLNMAKLNIRVIEESLPDLREDSANLYMVAFEIQRALQYCLQFQLDLPDLEYLETDNIYVIYEERYATKGMVPAELRAEFSMLIDWKERDQYDKEYSPDLKDIKRILPMIKSYIELEVSREQEDARQEALEIVKYTESNPELFKRVVQQQDLIRRGITQMKNNKEFIISQLSELLPVCIYDSSSLKSNPITLEGVKAIIDYQTVEGVNSSDIEMVVNLRNAYHFIAARSREEKAPLEYVLFTIHTLLGAGFIDELGRIRTYSISVGGTKYYSPYLPRDLQGLFAKYFPKDLTDLASLDAILELYCRLVYCQFFAECNDRTAKVFINYLMITLGHGLFTIPYSWQTHYRYLLLDMFDSGDFTDMQKFLKENCVMLISNSEIQQEFVREPSLETTDEFNV